MASKPYNPHGINIPTPGGVFALTAGQNIQIQPTPGGAAISSPPPSVNSINGLITPGTNVTISGSGTSASPYTISSSAGGGGVTSFNTRTGAVTPQSGDYSIGQITGAGTLASLNAAPAGTLTGSTLASGVTASSLTSVGTITAGVWNGTAIGAPYLPTASSSAFGIVKVDGTTITASGGVISAAGGIAIGNAVTSGTAGSVLYIGPTGLLEQDNANLHWDYTNKRLGIGGNAPQVPIDIAGQAGPVFLLYGQGGSNGYQSGIGVNLGQTSSSMGFFIGPGASFTVDAGNGVAGYTPFPYSSYTTRFTIDTNGHVGINQPTSIGAQLQVTAATASTVGQIIQLAASQTANAFQIKNNSGVTLTDFDCNGAWQPASISDSTAPNNSVYYSTTQSKLCYKDSGGVSNPLY